MALSLPTFPAWLWRNPNHDPTLDSNPNPSPIPNPTSNLNPNPNPNPSTNPNPNPNPNPNLTLTPTQNTHLSFSSSPPEAQYAILDGESNYQFQWINPNPNPKPNPNYSKHHHQAGEGNQSYREYQANRTQRKVIMNRQQRRRRRANAPQLVPSLDLDFDLVVVPSPPSDHNWSGSESEGSDWSVGWFEPHGPEFGSSEDNSNDRDNSFAVLVPCYGARAHGPSPPRTNHLTAHLDPESKSQLWAAVLSNVANDPHSGTNHYLQQWLSSLQS